MVGGGSWLGNGVDGEWNGMGWKPHKEPFWESVIIMLGLPSGRSGCWVSYQRKLKICPWVWSSF